MWGAACDRLYDENAHVRPDPQRYLLRGRHLREQSVEWREVRVRPERGGLQSRQKRLAASTEGYGEL